MMAAQKRMCTSESLLALKNTSILFLVIYSRKSVSDNQAEPDFTVDEFDLAVKCISLVPRGC